MQFGPETACLRFLDFKIIFQVCPHRHRALRLQHDNATSSRSLSRNGTGMICQRSAFRGNVSVNSASHHQEGWIGSLRVLAVYLAGVIAGSLGTSLTGAFECCNIYINI